MKKQNFALRDEQCNKIIDDMKENRICKIRINGKYAYITQSFDFTDGKVIKRKLEHVFTLDEGDTDD